MSEKKYSLYIQQRTFGFYVINFLKPMLAKGLTLTFQSYVFSHLRVLHNSE
jgi:hypothetical protein